MASFGQEQHRVALLMRRLGLQPDEYLDPKAAARDETGADVIAVFGDRRVGVQVTDLDTGDAPGSARRLESRLARDAKSLGTTYGTWAQNNVEKIIGSIVRSLTRKTRLSFAGFDDFWLLMCTGAPEWGAIGGTFVMTPWLTTDMLDAATLPVLRASKYEQAFIHAVFGVEKQAVYEWRRGGTWSKSTIELLPAQHAPDFWTYRNDPDLLRDLIGWREREIQRVLAELRGNGSADQ
jgi:hypothetical protein